ncbi:hypothetical protein HZB02_03830 [Candidatus Woesearchaeota archaeon]|nr:hypothetical protein [Candidatus Woesearchaeota archaeon]
MELLANLVKSGLSEKEAKTYLTCLELGDASASEIAHKGNLPRTLTYDLLQRLIELGLASYVIKKNKKYFRAAEPYELLRQCKEREEAVAYVMPQLETLFTTKGMKKPKTQVFEGKEGMKAVMNDILRSNAKEFLAYGSSRSSFEVLPAFMDEWHRERIRRRITMRVIYNNTPEARRKIKERHESLRYTAYKFMPIRLESPTATIIYATKVVLQSWTKEPFAVMIENEEMAENQKRYFKELWKIGL